MTPERLKTIETLFHSVRERAPSDRASFLAAACDDSDVRRQVEQLLAQCEAFVDQPVDMVVADLLAPAPRLRPGAVVGCYRIERLLDAGGMGEVYRARDSVLNRDVAIKILPLDVVRDRERLARFDREARLLATLNHPHVGAIYSVLDAEGVRGLVLELVEGSTLATRLAAGRLALDGALAIARQVADALEAAHGKGVVHRDLKPSNIVITREGVVKVIDFGLAKADDHADDPARTTPGLMVGTPAYMSPEQARGEPVDKRADVWAFGCILYEMLAGRHPFQARTASETIARILEREPDWQALPQPLSAAVRCLLRRCLTKNASDRLHDIADARIEIVEAMAPSTSRDQPTPSASALGRRITAALALIAAAAIIAVVSIMLRPRSSAPARVLEFPINISDSGVVGVAVAPDGHRVAFANFGRSGPQILVHALDADSTRALPGGTGGVMPFWSPDSSAVAFFAMDGKLKRTDVTDGSTSVLASVADPQGGSWNAAGMLLFSDAGVLFRVSAAGGTPTAIAVDDGGAATASRTFPAFLPDGRHFLYHSAGAGKVGVRVASLDSSRSTFVVESEYPAIFAPPSHLLYLRGTKLIAQRFDTNSFELTGQPSVVAENAAPASLFGPPGRLAQFSASNTGVLALLKSGAGVASQLTWFTRDGKPSGSIESIAGEYLNPSISPDGSHVAMNRMDPSTGNWDVWVLDLARNVSSRLTSNPAIDSDAVWSPDGKEIAFASNRSGRFGVYRKRVDGSMPEELIAEIPESTDALTPTDWSPDGQLILFDLPRVHSASVWALPLTGARRALRLVQGDFASYGARFSPDGQWIAYSSTETGTYELFVQQVLPSGGVRKQISHGGGVHPRWTSGGRELVYWAVPGGVAAIDISSSGDDVRVGLPRTLIDTPILNLIDGRAHYDATHDGRRFLLRQPVGADRPAITVVVNWTEKIKGQK